MRAPLEYSEYFSIAFEGPKPQSCQQDLESAGCGATRCLGLWSKVFLGYVGLRKVLRLAPEGPKGCHQDARRSSRGFKIWQRSPSLTLRCRQWRSRRRDSEGASQSIIIEYRPPPPPQFFLCISASLALDSNSFCAFLRASSNLGRCESVPTVRGRHAAGRRVRGRPVQSCSRGGGEDSGGHVLRETTSRGLCD